MKSLSMVSSKDLFYRCYYFKSQDKIFIYLFISSDRRTEFAQADGQGQQRLCQGKSRFFSIFLPFRSETKLAIWVGGWVACPRCQKQAVIYKNGPRKK